MMLDAADLAGGLEDLPSLPAVVMELLGAIEQEDIDIALLARKVMVRFGRVADMPCASISMRIMLAVLSLAPGLSTANYALGRFALLTWIPIALTYVIPQRYDKVVIPIGISLSFLVLVMLGLVGGFIVP